ncbi:hypothetical protein [Hymenobacter antarcticus]|uniref:Uncharacterized protein n=1 Tax=Hymenobacter antarcticus TaxID=486270 RepID=A0ABP7P8F0_9BACT
MPDPIDQPPAEQPNVAPEQFSGAALLTTPAGFPPTPAPVVGFQDISQPEPVPELTPLAVIRSDDGRVVLTDTTVIVRGQEHPLRELERAELTHVQWILWYLLGGMGLAAVMIAFLQNWLRTGPAMTGMALTALLLAYGRRGSNRLRLLRLGREMVNFALPGETPPWQRLTAELNRRIYRVHDHAARLDAWHLAAADAAMRQASAVARAAAEGQPGNENLGHNEL